MPEFVQQVIDFASQAPQWALVILFVLIVGTALIPIAEELLIIAAGVMLHRGWIENWVEAWLTCYIALLIADSIVVFLGWRFGKAILHRRWVKRMLHPRRVLWAHHQVQDHGAWVIAASRFIPGSRWATLLVAGMLHIKRWQFLVADGAAAAVSVTVQLILGFYLSKLTTGQFHAFEWWVTMGLLAAGVLLLIGYFLWIRFYGKTRAPRRYASFRLGLTRRARNRRRQQEEHARQNPPPSTGEGVSGSTPS
jgi:membrane protein DedA with SNARE-associated domain